MQTKEQNQDEKIICGNPLSIESNKKWISKGETSLFHNNIFKSNNFCDYSHKNRSNIGYNIFNQNISIKSINSNSNYESSIGIDKNYNSNNHISNASFKKDNNKDNSR